ncbi:MAG: adenylate kinase [Chloroflexi bacterium]|nr:adenylate kinase [Chloroflexota bacterium]
MAPRMRIVLFGAPGAGKGTQAKLLTEQLGASHIGSGDLFRHHLQSETPLGLRAAEYVNQGLLVPDDVTIDMILEKVMSLQDDEGFILDGFPRNHNQADALEEALARRSRKLDKVVFINVPEQELFRRLGQRYSCRQCQAPYTVVSQQGAVGQRCQHCGGELYQRDDDKPDVVAQRLETYETQTSPLIRYYERQGKLVKIDGEADVETVAKHLARAIGGAAGFVQASVAVE